jgi:hypothetical protein
MLCVNAIRREHLPKASCPGQAQNDTQSTPCPVLPACFVRLAVSLPHSICSPTPRLNRICAPGDPSPNPFVETLHDCAEVHCTCPIDWAVPSPTTSLSPRIPLLIEIYATWSYNEPAFDSPTPAQAWAHRGAACPVGANSVNVRAKACLISQYPGTPTKNLLFVRASLAQAFSPPKWRSDVKDQNRHSKTEQAQHKWRQ